MESEAVEPPELVRIVVAGQASLKSAQEVARLKSVDHSRG